MNLLKSFQLEAVIVRLLLEGECSTTVLLEKVRKIKATTKQGFYSALRKLRREEVILIYKKTVSLDGVWLKKMRDAFAQTEAPQDEVSDVLSLQNKESILYSFSNIRNLDTFWGHIQSILVKNTSERDPIFSYDPHYWFYLAREERERELLKEMVENKRQFLMTVGGETPLDKVIKSNFNNEYLQYTHKKILDFLNQYLTVVGEYVIEVTLDKKTSDRMEKIYKENSNVTEDVVLDLQDLLVSKGKNKLKVSRNKAKAEKLKKILSKDFFIIT